MGKRKRIENLEELVADLQFHITMLEAQVAELASRPPQIIDPRAVGKAQLGAAGDVPEWH